MNMVNGFKGWSVVVIGADGEETELFGGGNEKKTVMLEVNGELVAVEAKLNWMTSGKTGAHIVFKYGNNSTAINVNSGIEAGIGYVVKAPGMADGVPQNTQLMNPTFPGNGQSNTGNGNNGNTGNGQAKK